MLRLRGLMAVTLAASLVSCGSETPPDQPGARSARDGVRVQDGLERYLQDHSGGCFVLLRKPDAQRAAARALRRFRVDLFKSDVFASLDGQFGVDVNGIPLRYTPPYASIVAMTPDGPVVYLDMESVLDTFPDVI